MSTSELAPNFYARAERDALCDLMLQVGADAPTLCEGWVARDLAAHLVIREGRNPFVGAGVAVPLFAGLTAKAQAKAAAQGWSTLVEEVRVGPPKGSMMRSPKLDGTINTVEFFVHHEDVRRAQPDWEPRVLSPEFTELLWERTAQFAKRLVKKSPVGVVVRNSDGREATLHEGPTPVTVFGDPGEILMYLYRRDGFSRAAALGDDAAIAALRKALDDQ